MKIIGIACSPHRRGMTAELLDRALGGARAAGAETSVVRLADEALAPCRGCGGNCWETGACATGPDTAELRRRLNEADGIVMAVPVYCWQMNGLAHLFIDRMRWDTGSVLEHRNTRAAMGIACAGGSGTGCVMALQALYRYFYNWAFHGVAPLPVTRFNFARALDEARRGGEALAGAIREGIRPHAGLGEAMAELGSLPYMDCAPEDELRLLVEQLKAELPPSGGPDAARLHEEAARAGEALARGMRGEAARRFALAYEAGNRAFAGR